MAKQTTIVRKPTTITARLYDTEGCTGLARIGVRPNKLLSGIQQAWVRMELGTAKLQRTADNLGSILALHSKEEWDIRVVDAHGNDIVLPDIKNTAEAQPLPAVYLRGCSELTVAGESLDDDAAERHIKRFRRLLTGVGRPRGTGFKGAILVKLFDDFEDLSV